VSLLGDKYAIYVLAAYGATVAILVWLTWSSVAANAKARRDLAEMEKERRR